MTLPTTESNPRGQDLLLSGGFATALAAQAGYMPVCLDRVPVESFNAISVYLRNPADPAKGRSDDAFVLYCGQQVRFTEQHRRRLLNTAVKFVYIPIANHQRFRQQVESSLTKMAADPTVAASIRAEIIYQTSVELINELLSGLELEGNWPRVENVCRAVSTLVLNEPAAFSHLLATANHDFYTATHMVNVATAMVPLAYALGERDPEKLNQICQAGMVHDIGKMYVPAHILNKKARLTPAEWNTIRSHPEAGAHHLEKFAVAPLVLTVTRQHHERLDGQGYPLGLRDAEIDKISRICAVVDTFDAMTAFRPFKQGTMSAAEAVAVIQSETPARYDATVVTAWIALLQDAHRNGVLPEPVVADNIDKAGRRSCVRFPTYCPARVHLDNRATDESQDPHSMDVTVHSLSQVGVAFLSPSPIFAGEYLRLQMSGQGTLNRALLGLTVRCRDCGDGWFEIGMKFDEPATLDPSLLATAK